MSEDSEPSPAASNHPQGSSHTGPHLAIGWRVTAAATGPRAAEAGRAEEAAAVGARTLVLGRGDAHGMRWKQIKGCPGWTTGAPRVKTQWRATESVMCHQRRAITEREDSTMEAGWVGPLLKEIWFDGGHDPWHSQRPRTQLAGRRSRSGPTHRPIQRWWRWGAGKADCTPVWHHRSGGH